jgi:hypothetical protein
MADPRIVAYELDGDLLSEGDNSNTLFKPIAPDVVVRVGAVGSCYIATNVDTHEHPAYEIPGIQYVEMSTDGITYAAAGQNLAIGRVTHDLTTRVWFRVTGVANPAPRLVLPPDGIEVSSDLNAWGHGGVIAGGVGNLFQVLPVAGSGGVGSPIGASGNVFKVDLIPIGAVSGGVATLGGGVSPGLIDTWSPNKAASGGGGVGTVGGDDTPNAITAPSVRATGNAGITALGGAGNVTPLYVIQNGFESGTDGTSVTIGNVNGAVWNSPNSPFMEYDAGAAIGSVCMKFKGANGLNTGAWSNEVLNANVVELLFWYKSGSLSAQFSSVLDYENSTGTATPAADRAFNMTWFTDSVTPSNSTLKVSTGKATDPTGNGYTATLDTIQAFTPGTWYQYRILFDFSAAQRMLIFSRTSEGAAWTPLKRAGATTDYIPIMGANAVSTLHGLYWRGSHANGSEWWLDQIEYRKA